MSMDPSETSYFIRVALFVMAGLVGHFCISSLRFSMLRSATVLIGLLPGIVLVGAIAAVRVSDGSAVGAFGLAGLLFIGCAICAGILLARRLIGLQQGHQRSGDVR